MFERKRRYFSEGDKLITRLFPAHVFFFFSLFLGTEPRTRETSVRGRYAQPWLQLAPRQHDLRGHGRRRTRFHGGPG